MVTVKGLLRMEVINFGSKSQKRSYVLQAGDGMKYEVKTDKDSFAEPENSPLKGWLGKEVEVQGERVGGSTLIVKTIKAAS